MLNYESNALATNHIALHQLFDAMTHAIQLLSLYEILALNSLVCFKILLDQYIFIS